MSFNEKDVSTTVPQSTVPPNSSYRTLISVGQSEGSREGGYRIHSDPHRQLTFPANGSAQEQ